MFNLGNYRLRVEPAMTNTRTVIAYL